MFADTIKQAIGWYPVVLNTILSNNQALYVGQIDKHPDIVFRWTPFPGFFFPNQNNIERGISIFVGTEGIKKVFKEAESRCLTAVVRSLPLALIKIINTSGAYIQPGEYPDAKDGFPRLFRAPYDIAIGTAPPDDGDEDSVEKWIRAFTAGYSVGLVEKFQMIRSLNQHYLSRTIRAGSSTS